MAIASSSIFKTEGFRELETVLVQMADDFGYKKVGQSVVRPAVDFAFRPVLEAARSIAPSDTGKLRASIRQTTRRATDRDRKLRGATPTTAYVSRVSTRDVVGKAKAQEFGTKRGVEAKEYLRSALERNAPLVINNLQSNLSTQITKYKSKYTKKV